MQKNLIGIKVQRCILNYMKNKILLVTIDNLKYIGGTQVLITNFYRNLIKKGFDVEIINFEFTEDKKQFKGLSSMKIVNLLKFGKRGFLSSFSFTLNIFKFLSKLNKAKVIYYLSNSIFDNFIFLIYSLLGKKVIYGFFHKPIFNFQDLKNEYPFITPLLFEVHLLPFKFFFKFIKIHVANNADKKLLQNVLKTKNIITIPLFIPLPKINYKIKCSKKFNVLFVGKMDKYIKGLDFLIEIIKEVNKRIDKINFWIVGDGKDKSIIEELAKEYKNVKYFGKVDDKKLIELYKNSSLLIVTSRSECFHLVSIEAQYFGIPVIAFNIDVFKERKYIFKIKPFNIKSFANKILEIYKLWKENKEKYLELRRKIKEHSKIYTFDYIYEKYWKNILES